MNIKTVLIANRGEIACRIIRSARARGYRTVAIFTEPDRDAPHVKEADQAIFLADQLDAQLVGEAGEASLEPYLDIAQIIEVAIENNVDAIHPGYGFLSENAEFSKACQDASLIFVGPSPDAIRQMGDKAVAKRIMRDAGVPCVPGYEADDQDDKKLFTEAGKIGTPLLIKAVAGGGGRGMRRVDDLAGFDEALNSARSEALSAFGSSDVILERALDDVRHIEIQIASDSHGNAVHLFERDCSAQRRNQKVIEEAPSPFVDKKIRTEMGDIACNGALAIDYLGVGTFEFLMTPDGKFYFIEMNTRLQVEHPVTEMITGIDLVDWQFQIAEGHPLPCSQSDIKLNGAAIEVRLYAEDPEADFMPQTGKLIRLTAPLGEGVRFDSGVVEGNIVSPHYDPMLAKIITFGKTRDKARQRLVEALKSFNLAGVRTNRCFLVNCLEHARFINGEIDTGFIADFLAKPLDEPLTGAKSPTPDTYKMITLGVDYWLRCRKWSNSASSTGLITGTKQPQDWSSLGAPFRMMSCEIDGHEIKCGVGIAGDKITFEQGLLSDEEMTVTFKVKDNIVEAATVDGETIIFDYWWEDEKIILDFRDRMISATPNIASRFGVKQTEAEGSMTAPMDGRIVACDIAEADEVAADAILLVLEAMKMEHRIRAPMAGEIAELNVQTGDQVARGDLLVRIEGDTDQESDT